MLAPDALRLVAALVHTLPCISAVLEPDHGPEVVVGSDRRCLPDLSPCELRRLVAAQRSGEAPELSWVSAVGHLELGGPEVAAVVEDVVRVGGRDEPVLAFATLLGPQATRAVLRDVGREALAEGWADPVGLGSVRASTFHDGLLDVTTVVVAETAATVGITSPLEVVLASARACRVAELLQSVAPAG